VGGTLKALWFLGTALVATLFVRLFRALSRKSRGIDAFRENYSADGLLPVPASNRDEFPAFGRCIACGVCDRGEGARIADSGGAYSGVMSLMLTASRSMPDFPAVARSFRCIPASHLAAKQHACPANVPMQDIAGFVLSQAALASQPEAVAPPEVPSGD